MRLQLTVQRHGLPPAQVLWTLASAVRPPLLAAGNSITISQFLEQVNEVLPLESEDWGLEDYSVEVRGFECLHFAELNLVLKEDDEVCIRPLQTLDLRFRKISGRHQIAADGKHLVDGVAFGRPFLRRAERPALRIPPRKRRRITYQQEDDLEIEESGNDRQVIVRAGFDNDDVTAGDESDDDEDFAPDEEEEDDLGGELSDLQNDLNGTADADDSIDQDGDQPQRITRSRRSPKGLGLLKLLDDDGRPFTGQYNNPLLDLYGQDEAPSSQSEIRRRKRSTTDLAQNTSENIRGILRDSSASPQRASRGDLAGSNRSVRFENAEPATPATIRESEESEDSDDGDFEPGEVDESDKENAEPQNEETESSDGFFEGSKSSSSTTSDETSSSGSSSSSSSSDSDAEQQPSRDIAHQSKASDTSSSGSSSSSTSDTETESRNTGQKRKWAAQNVKSKTPANKESPTTRPGNGSQQTRSRNKRRKESKKLNFMKRKGILPAAASKSDLRKFDEETTESERQGMIAAGGIRAAFEAKRQDLLTSIAASGIDVSLAPNPREKVVGMTEDQSPTDDLFSKASVDQDAIMTDQPANEEDSGELEPDRQSANDPVNSSTAVEVQDLASDTPAKAKEISPTDSVSVTTTATGLDSNTTPTVEAIESLAKNSHGTSGAIEASKPTTPSSEFQHRRSKLDMSGAKRMLFGSLGLKTPKTKDEEMKVREKLMKDVRPVKELHVNEEIETAKDVTAAAEDDSWKDKIDLRAVECCYEGINLSTPPFPFVQRWDPQQQGGYGRGKAKKRKGKKRKRNNSDFYEETLFRPQQKDTQRINHDGYEDSCFNSPNKVVRLDDDHHGQEAESEPPTKRPNGESNEQEHSFDESFEDSVRVNEQLLHETEDASAHTLVEMEETNGLTNDMTNDLPTLPEDISICPPVTLDMAAKGNIVAFKQLEMSAETNWQPKISEYRTAIVDEILDDGTLSMTLAKRDQPSDNIQYDDQTGERLYSKFEMPGYHDENGQDTNGKLEISFDELINPVLVEAASTKGQHDFLLQGQNHVVAHTDSKDKAFTEEARDKDTGPQRTSSDLPVQEVCNKAAAEPSEEARQEISELIRDAGWRSSINGELIDRQDEESPGQDNYLSEPALVGPSSPKFRDFSSSTVNEFQVASSPPAAALQKPRHVHASGSEIAESVSSQGPNHSPARSVIPNRGSAIDYPDLPQINDDSEVFEQEAQDRSGILESDHQIASQDLTSPNGIGRSPSPSLGSPILRSPDKSSPEAADGFDGAESDESFPELFSQAFEQRMSQGRDIKSRSSEENPISPPSYRKSKRNSRINSSQRESNRDWEPDYSESEHEDDGGSTPRASQPGFSSQIVDLTISSDTVDPPDDSYVDDDSYVLPKGPGWVQKPRRSAPRDGPVRKTSTRGSLRSR